MNRANFASLEASDSVEIVDFRNWFSDIVNYNTWIESPAPDLVEYKV